jgi:mRNA interferase RelE/StbE
MISEYVIELTSKAEKDLKRLTKQVRTRVINKIYELKINRYPQQYKRLIGNNMARFRLRIGDYRVIYDVFDKNKTVLIYRIGHRREIYR